MTSAVAAPPTEPEAASTPRQTTESRWRQLAMFALPAMVALAARLLTGPHVIDDAYITFRYARNLAEGLGLVYNPGEWVLGTTAPLWAILPGWQPPSRRCATRLQRRFWCALLWGWAGARSAPRSSAWPGRSIR